MKIIAAISGFIILTFTFIGSALAGAAALEQFTSGQPWSITAGGMLVFIVIGITTAAIMAIWNRPK